MQFTININCDNAAFAPAHDNPTEAERHRAAMREINRLLRTKEWLAIPHTISAGLFRDANGNRVGEWKLEA